MKTFALAVLAALVVHCHGADAAEEPMLTVIYECPTGTTSVVQSDKPDAHLATLLVILGRSSKEQFLAIVRSVAPESEEAARRFLIECFGAPT